MIRFLRLEIKNLASLQGDTPHVIDFENGPLAECQIFSIVGPTGSGKSTILDAICLALYGSAPRYPLRKGQKGKINIMGESDEDERNRLAPTDPRNILTKGQRNGFSKLTFTANDGGLYRAEWHVSFKRKLYTKPATMLYRIDNGIEQERDWNSLPLMLGIDFDEFLRTVLIAQGGFAGFLNAKEDERYLLLEKLVGNGKAYQRIAEQVAVEREKAELDCNTLKAQCAAYENDILDEETKTTLQQEIAALVDREKAVESRREQVKKCMDWYQQEEAHIKNLQFCEAKASEAQQAMDSMTAAASRLQLHDDTGEAAELLRSHRSRLKYAAEQEQTLNSLRVQLEQQHNEAVQATEKLNTATAEAAKATDTLNAMMPHIQKARIIKAQIENDTAQLKVLQSEHDKAAKEAKEACDACERNRKEYHQAVTDEAEAAKRYDTTKHDSAERQKALSEKHQAAQDALTAARKLLEGCDSNSLQQAFNNAVNTCNDIEKAIHTAELTEQKRTTIEQQEKRAKILEADTAGIVLRLSALHPDVLEKEVSLLNDTYTLMNSEQWAHHRRNLKEGEACPLCGADHHPYAADYHYKEAADKLGGMLKEKREHLKSQRKEQQDLSTRKANNDGVAKNIHSSLDTLRNELQQLENDWLKIAQRHPEWERDIAQLKVFQASALQAKQDAGQAMKRYNDALQEATHCQRAADAATQALLNGERSNAAALQDADSHRQLCTTRRATLEVAASSLQQQCTEKKGTQDEVATKLRNAADKIAVLKESADKETGGIDPDAYENTLQQRCKETVEAVNGQKELLAKLAARHSAIEGEIKATTVNKRNAEAEATRLLTQLKLWISSYNSSHPSQISVATIEELATSPDDWNALRNTLQERRNALTAAQTTLRNERESIAKHQEQKPAESLEDLEAERQQLAQQNYRDTLLEKQAVIRRHENAMAQLGGLAKAKAEADSLKADWDAIYSAIGFREGKDLRKIAQCYTLRFLVELANTEIAKFNRRYALEQVKNSLGIRVIDHDRFDERRDTTSLSGGETFVVSLGLALGLASLSPGNAAFANLFIDEGFGTLDPENLATVIAALSAMQSHHGKKVGVISHTESMSEGIQTKIRVIKDGNTGTSHIEVE